VAFTPTEITGKINKGSKKDVKKGKNNNKTEVLVNPRGKKKKKIRVLGILLGG